MTGPDADTTGQVRDPVHRISAGMETKLALGNAISDSWFLESLGNPVIWVPVLPERLDHSICALFPEDRVVVLDRLRFLSWIE